MSTQPPVATDRHPRWPWVMLGLGLVWTVLIRVPLVLNAEDHLDSDLAVDGLTLLDAVKGHWRWHYPGTPYMGILPLLLSLPQSLIWGANAITLVSGGTVIWVCVVASTFWVAWRAFSLEVAGWSVVPLVFSSLGTIWLSSRITGGHLVTLVWHNLAFAGLYATLATGGWQRAGALGLWCGLGLYLDAMFLLTLAGLLPLAVLAWFKAGSSRTGIRIAAVFIGAMLAGLLPREIGRWLDPYDAYPAQFATTFEGKAFLEHCRLLGRICIPRLIGGIELPALEREIHTLGSAGVDAVSALRTFPEQPVRLYPVARVVCGTLPLMLFVTAVIWLALDRWSPSDPARRALRAGVLMSALLIVVAFLVNRNIYNSDNYRYLVFLLTPWALGFGALFNYCARTGWLGRLAAGSLASILAAVMTMTALDWYQLERHYVSRWLLPVQVAVRPWNEPLVYDPHPAAGQEGAFSAVIRPDVTHVFGPYWEVYRLSFRSAGKVAGIPFPIYPNRFPGWSRGLGTQRGRLLVLQPFLLDWRNALAAVWRVDGRDPTELYRLRVTVPSRESARR